MTMQQFLVGLDVGSTTVKTVVRSAPAGEILFHDYRRHEGQQASTVLHMLQKAKRELGMADERIRVFMTGSGGQHLAELLGARFVQEVAAVSLAVETSFPEVRSVIELGGQDAKMIIFQEGAVPGQRKKIASMNDKCAGGTGVVIEKIAAKLHIASEELFTEKYEDAHIYPVAGKCGVFAETDITGLQKQGVPVSHLMASLFNAIVLQNLSVLTRGNTLMPNVFLLGGPNAYFPGLQAAWRRGLLDLWKRKNVALLEGATAEEMVSVPPMAEYFGAIGAIQFGAAETEETPYQGTQALELHIRESEASRSCKTGSGGLCRDEAELSSFRRAYSLPAVSTPAPARREREVFVGLDGGSTSTKAVALSPDGAILASSYRLSQSDPITDAIAVLKELRWKLNISAHSVKVLGLGTTGYSKDLLKKVLSADVALVETVAHANSSLRVFPDVDAIIDVGGQDIKIIVLKDGAVKDFRLNTQCSAGNGYFLQAAAESFGIRIENFADVAFQARRIPQFSYGCAVFLQSDIVNFQRQGWRPEEILAGLATVLPKNIFLYVAGVSNVATLGSRFVLQGGTQRNLAVVKAEVDFIHKHYHGEGVPEVVVHPNCCEAGAIGAALEAAEVWRSQGASSFPGFEFLDQLEYSVRRDESTRCHFCTNRCLRTFVELSTDKGGESESRRVIIATCERGEAESADEVRKINNTWYALRQSSPNYVQLAAEKVWLPVQSTPVISGSSQERFGKFSGRAKSKTQLRSQIRIGIPRVLNLYIYAPLFSTYLVSLGVPARNLHYSRFSTPEKYQEAAGFSAIDPCFPSKVAVAHIYELIKHCEKEPLDAIFFPMFDVLTTHLENCVGSNACPSGAATPEAVKAAFYRKVNWFQKAGVQYLNPVLNMMDRELFKYQMFNCWKELLHLDWEENVRAVDVAFAACSGFENEFRRQARQTLDDLERSGGIGLVMLGRPYHHDPGLNQGIFEELHRLGYPIFSQGLLPLDKDLLDRLFGADVEAGLIRSPLDISDVWKNTFSTNSNHKIWAAKLVARHPNLISVELSNFKCGHDAFISRLIERIIAASGKPHFSFRDLDENRPLASIRIRIETMQYFLKHYRDQLKKKMPIAPPPRQPRGQRNFAVLSDIHDWQIPPEWPPAGVEAGRSAPEDGVQL
jgi:predicted CoA-substrate-specific enzyme activase